MSSTPFEGPPSFDPRLSGSFILKLVVLVVLVIASFQSISYYVENLWFDSLGFQSVYWYGIKARALLFLAFFAATTAILWIMFRLVTPTTRGPKRAIMELNGQPVYLPGLETVHALIRPAAILIGAFLGLAFSSQWMTFALYLNRTGGDAVVDPIFGKSISFYFFTMPVLSSVAGWLMTLAVIVMIPAVLLTLADGSGKYRGVSIGVSFLLAAGACQTLLARYGLVLQDHGLFSGVNYVSHSVLAPGLAITAAALGLGSLLALLNLMSGRLRNLLIAIALPAVTYAIAGVAVPSYVTTFVVRPNELVRETPYIKNNIEFTRKAFDIDKVEQIPFEPQLTNATIDANKHRATLDNVRLWDWRALQDTLRQIQEIRTYYDFPDVDIDRYTIDGKPVEMMLAARELSLNKLPTGTRNWVNERLIYTHGYGVTMNPVSKFTKEGLPQFTLSNMPVESTQPSIQVKRPEIYFGEITDWPVYANTRQKEFNYPEGDANNYNTYSGTGGIKMGGFFRRLLLAFEMGDITKVPFSNDITPDSVLLLRRNIIERVRHITPFLTPDSDPYLIVGEDGGLYWMIDAYTHSEQYPYSRHLDAYAGINYIRNSVKIVVDAYNGTVSYYVFDPSDPLISSYQKMLPTLFKPASAMPTFLRKHIRYPETLNMIQANIYSTYHVENEQVFYNREDIWTVAQQGRTQGNGGATDAPEPFYVLMSFPGETELEFVAVLPFTPANRNNLIGWLGARSDGDNYGKLRGYHFPKTRFVDGPLQMQARIDQNSELSSQLTLWNQQGSKVIRGNLLIMPLDNTLLYIEPIYLQAERSPMPELRLVVLLTQDKLAYAPNFDDALKMLLEGTPQSAVPNAASTATGTRTGNVPTMPAADIKGLIARANQAFVEYRRLTSEGKLGEAGAKLDELKKTLEELTRSPR